MTLKEFKTLLDIHGADLGKWPHDRRVAAMAFLDQSEAAKLAFAEAAELDARLRANGPELGPERRLDLIDGIMESIETDDECPDTPEIASERQGGGGVGAGVAGAGRWPHATGGRRSATGVVLPGAGLLAACLAVGILCGIAVTQLTGSPSPVSPVFGGVELWVR